MAVWPDVAEPAELAEPDHVALNRDQDVLGRHLPPRRWIRPRLRLTEIRWGARSRTDIDIFLLGGGFASASQNLGGAQPDMKVYEKSSSSAEDSPSPPPHRNQVGRIHKTI